MTRHTSIVVSVDPDGQIIVRDTKATYVLHPAELLGLLPAYPELWKRAVRRGKHLRRCEATAARMERYAKLRERRQEREV